MLKKLEDKIQNIKDEIYALGYQVIEANKLAFNAVNNNELQSFKVAKTELKNIDVKASEIDNLIVTTLALFNLEAKDLREMVSYLKITNEIARAGMNTKNFIKGFERVPSLDIDIEQVKEYSVPLHKSSIAAFENALAIIKIEDKDQIDKLYQKTAVEESKTDDLYSIIEKNLLMLITKDYELTKDYIDTLRAIRKLEKVAGRALSIANLLVYAEIGGEIHQ